MTEKSGIVLSTSEEIYETAQELDLEECSHCGKKLKLERRSGLFGTKIGEMIFTYLKGKTSNIKSVHNFPNEEPEAFCTDCKGWKL